MWTLLCTSCILPREIELLSLGCIWGWNFGNLIVMTSSMLNSNVQIINLVPGVYHHDTLCAGDVALFPRGLLHFEQNLGTTNCTFISALNSQNPGVLVCSQINISTICLIVYIFLDNMPFQIDPTWCWHAMLIMKQ